MAIARRLLEDGSFRLLESDGYRLLEDSDPPTPNRGGSGSEYHGSAVRRQREQMYIDHTVSGRPGGVQWPRGG